MGFLDFTKKLLENETVRSQAQKYMFGNSEIIDVPSETTTKNEVKKFEDPNYDPTDKLLEVTSIKSPIDAAKAVKVLIETTAEVAKYCEHQKTIRHQITVQKDMYVEKIKATERILSMYLEKTFDERRRNFDNYFKAVDEAIRTGNNQALAMCLDKIDSLAQSSPFKALSDFNQFDKMLNSDEPMDVF